MMNGQTSEAWFGKFRFVFIAGERDQYEYELRMDLLGHMIKTVRTERNLTQEQPGELVGVQKAQISKLENNANSATIGTILKVFKALKADINFNVKIDKEYLQLA
ncbi:XRE family transcriptional regulator [Ferruginibacter sp. HRS2-29]|nr:XRE family transcriptional regulator [Ferruginibacter sp. HRS2-29]